MNIVFHVLDQTNTNLDNPRPLPFHPPPSKNALHERKWLAFLGLSVALYLNPIMVVGNFVAPASASWGLASEMSSSVATAVFLVVVLCIADGIARNRINDGDRYRGSRAFYFPKVGILFS